MFGKFGKFAIRGLESVLLLWLLSAAIDRLWLGIDRSIPSWDPADNLTNALHFLPTLAHANLFSGDWWTEFWTRSSKYPPLLFATTALFLRLFGQGADQALLVNLLFSLILLLSVYGIGRHLLGDTSGARGGARSDTFGAQSDRVGVWAAGLCVLLPRLYVNRLQYFMDFPLAATVALSFYCLTLWRDEQRRSRQWVWAIGFGISFGLAILTKQSALLFFLVPLLWLLVRQWRQWERWLQLGISFLITLAITLPWVCTNWIYQISAAFNSNVKSAIDEGDPSLNSIAAWTYYWQDLPSALSWPLLVVPIVGLAWWLMRRKITVSDRQGLGWLLVFWLGAFGLWSAVVNKDGRYILPALPIVAIVLAYGLTRWRPIVGRVTIALAGGLMLSNLAIGNPPALAQWLSPQAQLHPDPIAAPQAEVIDEIIRAQPLQIANLGMLASTPTVNQHTFNYFGNLRNFQVFSRQMGRDKGQTDEELRSLSWFLTNTTQRRADEGRRKLIEAIERSPDFQLDRTWMLPGRDRIQLYRRSRLPVAVQPIALHPPQVTLDRVVVPARVPPDQPIPVTYTWSGSWQQLTSGLVLVTWQSPSGQTWIHDHGIGLGSLYPPAVPAGRSMQVTEQTAMQPIDLPGTYRLEAIYLNAETGETYPIATPPVTVTLDPAAPAVPTPELDWVTQLRSRAADLPQGSKKLEEIFFNIAQLNMFDPIQAYAGQAATTLATRMQQEPTNRDYAYGLTLAHALQQQVKPTIAALEQVVKLDAQNPNAYTYLAAAQLYALHPIAAQHAIDSALQLAPEQSEVNAIASAAALMRGNFWQAWRYWQKVTLPAAS